uniref:Branched-chain amino acid transport system permease protein n=1 Tax=Candidatus Kentrum eta TaxID=2126337 RepID=A0A450V4K8_9GAMM|nr:MAG: branched-chain amino acid transport system permease protein [Candidatus Kentron sp. H]VFJ99717.1 MAG: branched-chain amino acid transport system permease protein [Candidatus Kentron sp. H]VFK04173.1 MAG: branched-chain amino acid transport system permease protein [Candidatus Kentron sp. H]
MMRMMTPLILALILVVPLAAYQLGNPFYLDIATRLVIFAIAAISLNLVLGYGGLLSFGHAAFIGIGAYAVGIPAWHDLYGGWAWIASSNGFVHLGLAMLLGAVFALVTGAIGLRTRGVHFIMITLAFGQMMYYFFVSLETYGGDDGLVIDVRSQFPLVDLDNPVILFLCCFGVLLAVIHGVHRLIRSRFGMIIRGAKSNDQRLRAIGINPYPYRLTAWTISGALCSLSGALLGNFNTFISPEMMGWTHSGELIFMVILGGAGTLFGPVFGAAVFLLLEEFLSSLTTYWHLPFGLILIGIVLFRRGGVADLVRNLPLRRARTPGDTVTPSTATD